MKLPKITNAKPIIAIKNFEILPIVFKNSGGEITEVLVNPNLPLGLHSSIENETCVLSGTPTQVSARAVYTVTVSNPSGNHFATIEVTVIEAPIKTQRGDIIAVNDVRRDLDTPRSQIENAITDEAMMGNTIKPHEKFVQQPMGDDKRLSQQTANNAEAENRAQNDPELTPSPSAKLQQQASLRAKPSITPSPTR